MGHLNYGGIDFELDDRVLAHLQVVLSMKLRRGENFFLSWPVSADLGSGRHSIWMDSGVPIYFRFSGSRLPIINREWVETLAQSATTTLGLVITPEGELVPHEEPAES